MSGISDAISPARHPQKSSQHVRSCAARNGAICSKNRKIIPYHRCARIPRLTDSVPDYGSWAYMIKTRPSKESWAISLLRRRKLKIYRQNQKVEQIAFVLMCKVSNKKQIWPRQMAFQNSYIFLLLLLSSFISVKTVGKESGSSESASGINLPSLRTR